MQQTNQKVKTWSVTWRNVDSGEKQTIKNIQCDTEQQANDIAQKKLKHDGVLFYLIEILNVQKQ